VFAPPVIEARPRCLYARGLLGSSTCAELTTENTVTGRGGWRVMLLY